MSHVISFVNTKGGVGKSFLSTSISVWLFDQGFRVCLVDADDQQTSTKWIGDIANHSVVVRTLEKSGEEQRADELRQLVNQLSQEFDFIAIDTKGSAGLTTSAAVIKSDLACVPLQPSAADIWPIENALSTIRLSQEARGGIPKSCLILNQTDYADIGARRVRKLAKKFGIPIANTNIRRLRVYRNAPGDRIAPTRIEGPRNRRAAMELERLFCELVGWSTEEREVVCERQ